MQIAFQITMPGTRRVESSNSACVSARREPLRLACSESGGGYEPQQRAAAAFEATAQASGLTRERNLQHRGLCPRPVNWNVPCICMTPKRRIHAFQQTSQK